EVIVDSSKSPSYGQLLAMLPSVNLHVVHLVRDPRGTAFSWRRNVVRTDSAQEKPMQRMSVTKSSALWSIWNLTAERVWNRSAVPYLRIRYEDLIADPSGCLERSARLVGASPGSMGFINEGSVRLDSHHTISGNPMRLTTGEIELKPDMEWVTAMPLAQRLVVTALTAHSLGRYGYPLRRPQQLSFSRPS
ncbi:MAG TPA: sulfotransferase, partial [Actinomycetota bacterium]|nr:sulfotransferase [Actinomycetota bacterium]